MLWNQRYPTFRPSTPATPPSQEQHEHEDVLHHRRTSSAPAEESIAPTASAFSTGQATATPKRSTLKRGS